MSQSADTIDVADLIRSLRRGWRAIASFTVVCLGIAVLVLVAAPRQYQSSASVVLRASEPLGPLARIGGFGGALGSDAAGALSGMRSPIETELQIIGSRSVVRAIADSLALQARVLKPSGVAPTSFISNVDVPGSFKRKKIHFSRVEPGVYQASGPQFDTLVRVGQRTAFLGGALTLRENPPPEFTLQILDVEDAVGRVQDRLSVAKAGGDVVRVSYSGDDSLTAALVPNTILSTYLARRKTTDRGVNQYRVEFLMAKLDSTGRELADAERALRRYQELSGVLDAQVYGRLQLERGAELRKQLVTIQVEEGAINQLLAQAAAGLIDRRQLAAYPAFLRSSSLNDLISQLSTLEAERLRLLERRTERDPEVVALTRSIDVIEGQFLPLAQSYSSSLAQQRKDLNSQIDTLQAELGVLPGTAEAGNRLQRDVLRLGQIYAAMQAQLVEARLAAIGEGGDARQLDVAVAPKKPSFPKPIPTLMVGGSAGLLLGVVAALILSVFGRWARDPAEIERTTGIPTLLLDRRAPLIVANGASRAVLVIPLHSQADTLGVARQLVETAMSRATSATLLDVSGNEPALARADAEGLDVNRSIERLLGEFASVVVRLPGLASDATLAALKPERPVVFVVPAGPVARGELMSAMQTLRRLDIPCAGIVVSAGAVASVVGNGARALQG